MISARPSLSDILEERLPAPVRVLLAAGGLLALVAPALELAPGVYPLSLATPFFLVIICGAASVGLPMFFAAAADVGTRWTLESHALRIEFLAIGFARDWRLHHAQGATADIQFDDDAPAHAAHRIVVRSGKGKRFLSPPFRTHAEAEAYLARVRARIGQR
jgi:hypothetical protein